jgi:hypothetical protein
MDHARRYGYRRAGEEHAMLPGWGPRHCDAKRNIAGRLITENLW